MVRPMMLTNYFCGGIAVLEGITALRLYAVQKAPMGCVPVLYMLLSFFVFFHGQLSDFSVRVKHLLCLCSCVVVLPESGSIANSIFCIKLIS